MLTTELKQQLVQYLTYLKQGVNITVALGNDAKSAELKQLAETLSELSALITIHYDNSFSERVPAMRIGERVTFAAVPMGHEFTSLVLALLQAGGHPLKLSDEQVKQIQQVDKKINFESYISLSCQNCPDVVQSLNLLALLNPNIHHTMIDGALFEQEVKQRNIMAVPTVMLNGENFSQGRISLDDILMKINDNYQQQQIEQLNSKELFDVLVVGAGPAGASAAIYAARKGLKTGIVADRFGGQVLDTVGIENFISVKATEGPKLVASLEEHVRDYPVDIITNQKVADLQLGEHFTLPLSSGAALNAKIVIIATGARWRNLNVPGEQEYTGKGVAYCPHCDGPLFKGKDVAVIGGGNSGIEAALDLAGIVNSVTVLEFDNKLRADQVLINKAKATKNITIITSAQTTEVVGDGNKVTGINYLDRATNKPQHIELAGIFVQIGLVPNSEFLPDSIKRTPRGEIITNNKGETSVSGVFAAGDVTDCPFKQIIIAMGNGANASLGAFEHLLMSDNSTQQVA